LTSNVDRKWGQDKLINKVAVTTKLDVLPHVNIEYFKDKSLTGRSKEH
jgi:hypothetical protein